ncbi:MAG: hypothetical protein KDC46_01435 [Thermoleophilia bacterium]|nr:hypothetical protein [Thermoleophilia bacterium]
MYGYHHHSTQLAHPAPAPNPAHVLVPAHAPMPPAPPAMVHVRTAELHQQRSRQDGVLQFVALLALVCIVFIASVAFVRGTPVDPPAAPAPAPAASTPTASTAG